MVAYFASKYQIFLLVDIGWNMWVGKGSFVSFPLKEKKKRFKKVLV